MESNVLLLSFIVMIHDNYYAKILCSITDTYKSIGS